MVHRSPYARPFLLLLCLIGGACSVVYGVSCGGEPDVRSGTPAAAATPAAAPPDAESSLPRIVCLGDSLTAGYGLLESQSYPALLQARLDQEGYEVQVVNAGVSGDTSAGALRRLDWALDGDVRLLIIALGGNDALRGLSVDDMTRNLGAIIERAQENGIAVLLAGMEAPPNFGPDYTVRFREAFRELARRYRVSFVPFLLEGVAGVPALNQADGIHPNTEGTRIVADTLWAALTPMIDHALSR
jgi:acyl-CoA thioesterase-1